MNAGIRQAMVMSNRSPHSYEDVMQWAAPQAGVVGRTQLMLVGWTDSMIRTNLIGHRWDRLVPGVYNTVTGEPSIHAWWWAAHLYGGNDSRLSGLSALQAWGMQRAELPVHLAVPDNQALRSGPTSLMIHRHRHPRPTRCPNGFPPTIVFEHAVLDVLADVDDEQDVMSLVTKACQPRPWMVRRLERALAERVRVRHRKLIVALLAEVRDGATTALEIPGVRKILRAHELPTGRGQAREVQGGALVLRDRVIDDYGVVIEFDGRLGHDDPNGRLRDHRRDNAVTLSGRAVLRFGWVDVHREACEAAVQVAEVLSYHGWTGRLEPCGPACRVRIDA